MTIQKLILTPIVLSLTRLGTAGRVALAAVIGKVAPQSAIYLAVPAIQALADKVVKGGADVDAKTKDVDAKRKAYIGAVTAKDAADQQLAADIAAYKGAASGVCKTELDVEGLGLSKAPPAPPPVPLTAPTAVTAKTGKEKGTFTAQAARIAGLFKYIVEISPDPITATSFQQVAGTASKRTFSGYESGKGYWIRYCTERGQQRSSWSDPVYVIAR